MWLVIATSLAVFRVSKVVEKGVEVTPEVRYTDTFIRYIDRDFTRLSTNMHISVTRRSSNVASSLVPLGQKR